MELKEKLLEKAIQYKVGKFKQEPLNELDLEKVTELSISDTTFLGKKLNIDLSEITFLQNLESLTLQNFEITNDIVTLLNQLPKLTHLQFSTCQLKNRNLLVPPSLESLYFENTDVRTLKFFTLPQILQITGAKYLTLRDFTDTSEIEFLYLQNCRVQGISNIHKLKKLKELNLDGSLVDNKKTLMELPEDVEISYSANGLPIR